jgi:hypothetical protein
MPTYEAGNTTPAAGSAAAYATFNTNARRGFIREMGMFTTAATASSIGFGVPGNTPSTFSGVTPQPKDAADIASTCTLAVNWTTVPTTPTTFFRKVTLGAAVGAGVIWKVALDERWILGTGTKYFVWWNYAGTTAAALDMYEENDE